MICFQKYVFDSVFINIINSEMYLILLKIYHKAIAKSFSVHITFVT